MKITYQKEGTGPKRSLQKLQRFNFTLWKTLRFVLILFIFSFGLFTFVSSKQSPDPDLLPIFTPEEARIYTHNKTAYNLLETHKAPSVSFALLGQFILHKENVRELTYEDREDSVVLTFKFAGMSEEELLEEKNNLESTGLFTSIKQTSSESFHYLTTTSSPEVFLYSQTLALPEEQI